MELIRNCPICGSQFGRVLHHQRFAHTQNDSLPLEYDVVCCSDCEFTFADTSASQQDYDRHYGAFNKYEDKEVSSGAGLYKEDQDRLKVTASTIRDAIQGRSSNSSISILDIGCANGGLLLELRGLGFENLFGLDPSDVCCSTMARAGISAFQGGLFDIPRELLGRTFDCIILSHVLEHVRDLRAAVKNIRKLLSDKGSLYVEVPDATKYPEYYFVPYYYFDCEHINHFDPISLQKLFGAVDLFVYQFGQKHFSVNGKQNYPAMYQVFSPVRDSNKLDFTGTKRACASVTDYVQLSVKSQNLAEIDKLAKSGVPLLIWGAGENTLRLLGSTSLGKCNIVGFIDNNKTKQGMMVNGIEVHAPEFVTSHVGPILISSALFSSDIEAQIKKMEWRGGPIFFV